MKRGDATAPPPAEASATRVSRTRRTVPHGTILRRNTEVNDMNGTIRVLTYDPAKAELTPREFDEKGFLEACYRFIGCDLVDVVRAETCDGTPVDIWIDDSGLLVRDPQPSIVNEATGSVWTVGRVVIAGRDGPETVSVPHEAEVCLRTAPCYRCRAGDRTECVALGFWPAGSWADAFGSEDEEQEAEE